MKIITAFRSVASFDTERLTVVKLTEADVDKFDEMHTNEQVMATLGGTRTGAQTQDNLAWNLRQWQENGFGLWMFYLKNSDTWIGRGGIRRVKVDGNKEEAEVTYALMPAFWNKGFATEITQACTEVAFEVLRLQNLACYTYADNARALNVMKKVGFAHERDFVVNENGIDRPCVMYRMTNYRKAVVVNYDKKWPEIYAKEAELIKSALGASVKKIHHFGSTAIPDMPAKPIIDMLLEMEDVSDIAIIKSKLAPLGYLHIRRQVIPHRSFNTSRYSDDIGYHVHIYEEGDPQVNRHLDFRDYTIAHPEAAKAYANLKLDLAKKYKDDITSYVLGKDKLVQEIDTKAKLCANRNERVAPVRENSNSWSQEKMLKAMVANFNVYMTYFAQYIKQMELIRIPGYTIVNTGLADETCNYVLDADFSHADAEKKISEVTHYFKQKNLPFSWWICPYDKPDDLLKLLTEHGYSNKESLSAVAINLDECHPPKISTPELKIIRALDKKSLEDFARVAGQEHYFSQIADVLTSSDPIEFYVGYVDNKPLVRGAICYYAGLAGFYSLVTSSEAREKGYASALHTYRLERAKKLGFYTVIMQATPELIGSYHQSAYTQYGVFSKLTPHF